MVFCVTVSVNKNSKLLVLAKKAIQIKFYAKTIISNSVIKKIKNSIQVECNRWDKYFFNAGIEVSWNNCEVELWYFGQLRADLDDIYVRIERKKLNLLINFFGSKEFTDRALPKAHRDFIYNLGKSIYPFLYS